MKPYIYQIDEPPALDIDKELLAVLLGIKELEDVYSSADTDP